MAKSTATKAIKSKTTTKAASKTTPVKKTTVKKSSMVQPMKVEKVEEKKVETKASAPVTKPSTPVKVKKRYVVWAIVIVVLGALLYLGRSLFVAAVVNGQPISRLEVVQQSEKQGGKAILDGLVRNALIEQEARKQNITVSDQEIDDEIKKVEGNLSKQGQKLDQVLQMQGMNREELRKLIKLDKLVSKIVGKEVTVTDEEVNKYIEDNKASLPEGQDEEAMKKEVKESLKQQKLNQKVQTWLADLQNKAQIIKFVSY